MAQQALSHSAVLRRRMQVTCSPLYGAYRRFWASENLALLLPAFLILMHQIVRASVPLMQAARAEARARSGRAVHRQLAAYLSTHIRDERRHDEWLLEDLAAAGLRRRDVLASVPAPAVAALVGAQYYWIHHHEPAALLGYIRLLEGNPPSREHVDDLRCRSGLPESVFRTYRLHGELDPTHLGELDSFIDTLPLSDSQARLIWLSASHTAAALAGCLEDLRVAGADERAPLPRRAAPGAASAVRR